MVCLPNSVCSSGLWWHLMVLINIYLMVDITEFIFMFQLFMWTLFWSACSYLLLTDMKLFTFSILFVNFGKVFKELCQIYLSCLIYWYKHVHNNLFIPLMLSENVVTSTISDNINLYFFFIFMTINIVVH